MSDRMKGFILAVLAGALWGISGVVGQYLFAEQEVNATWLVCYRLLFSGVILLGYLRYCKKDITEIWKNKNHGLRMLLHSIAGMMMVQFTFFKAIEASNAGTATVLQYLNPTLMLIFFAVFKKKKPSRVQALVVLMALIGTFLVATGGSIHNLTLSPSGLFWGLACAVVTCIYAILPIKLLEIYDAKLICGWGMLIGGIVLSIISQLWTLTTPINAIVVGSMLYIIIFGTIIPYTCSLMSLPLVGPVNSNLISSIEPIIAAVVAFLFLGTLFSIGEVIGFGFIIGTLIILAKSKK